METFTNIIRELEAERNQALSENKTLQAELHRLNQEMNQTKHDSEVSKREIEKMKQVYTDVQHLQSVVQKKEEESMEMMKHIQYLSEEKAALEMLLKTGRSDLGEAEKEIIHLRHCLQEKDNRLEQTLQVVREVDAQKQHLSEQLAKCKNALQMSVMHEESLRQQLSGAYKLEAEVEERSRVIGHLQEALENEKQTSDELMQGMRALRKDLEAACAGQEKAHAELEALQKKTQALTRELGEKQEENESMRRNVEEIRKEIQTIRKQDISSDDLVRSSRTYDSPCGDQRSKFSSALLRTRRKLDTVGETSDTMGDPDCARTSRRHAARNSRLLNSYLSSVQHREPVEAGNPMENSSHASTVVTTNPEERFRLDRFVRRSRMRKSELSSDKVREQ